MPIQANDTKRKLGWKNDKKAATDDNVDTNMMGQQKADLKYRIFAFRFLNVHTRAII